MQMKSCNIVVERVTYLAAGYRPLIILIQLFRESNEPSAGTNIKLTDFRDCNSCCV